MAEHSLGCVTLFARWRANPPPDIEGRWISLQRQQGSNMRVFGRRSTMGLALTASVAVMLAACSPQPEAPGADPKASAPGVAAGDGFYSEFRAANDSAKAAAETGGMMNGKMYRSGQNVRMEFTDAEKGDVVIISTPTHTIMIGSENGKPTGIKLPGQDFARTLGVDLPDFTKADWLMDNKGQLKGPCTAMGQTGQLYAMTDAGENTEACVSAQGWPLEVKEAGKVVWQTVKYTPGAQDPALFVPPAGVDIMDLDAMMKGFGPEMEKMMKEGFGPEMEKMMKEGGLTPPTK
jgi:hypothetical protein